LPPSSRPPSWSGPAGSPPSFLPGRPVVLEAKQEAKTKTSNSAGKKEAENSARPKKRSRTKPSEITWKTCPSLPDGWKTRIVFWSDREKPLFLTPSGKTLTSRKAVIAAMQLIGTYSQEDFEKVKKGSHKRKKKPNNQWVPTKKKGKGKGKGTIGKVKDTTKGQKKTGNNGEKIAKVESKEGKAKTKAPRGLSRALTKLAKQYVGYLDGEGRKKLRHCHVNLNPVAITEAEKKMAVDMLAVQSEMSSRPTPRSSSIAHNPDSSLPSLPPRLDTLALTSSRSPPPTDPSLTHLKPDQSSSNQEGERNPLQVRGEEQNL